MQNLKIKVIAYDFAYLIASELLGDRLNLSLV